MTKQRATITGIGAYVPEYVLTNDELSKMVDTSDEWIMTRIGIKERRIIKEKGEGSSFVGTKAVNKLLEKTGTSPDEVDLLICATVTPDHQFPATANIISDKVGIRNAFSFDLNAGCSGFLYALNVASKFVEAGTHKKVIVVGAEKMSSIVDYQDRSTCPIFGDGAGAVLLEPTTEDIGIVDSIVQADGVGRVHLHQKAGGSVAPASHETIDARQHYIYQEGQPVFKWAVSKMADVSVEMMKRHGIEPDDLAWLVPHQANMRIIEATAKRMGIKREQVMINIQRYGNTTAATLPLCLWEWEDQLKKGDNIILATFGAGFTWGSMYVKWGYDGKDVKK
ncbi:MAG: beta-ketoacyl-ACP synthase III [Bacteroidales bacterium]